MVGRLVQCISPSDARREPEWVLAGTISLTSTQAQQPFDRLQTYECALREMADTDAAVARERMAAAVRLLIDYLPSEGYHEEHDIHMGEEYILPSWISDSAAI